jgi:hypothetical protein
MTTDLIITRNGYGFGGDWQMICRRNKKTKTFYLGQDAKVCYRIIGMSPKELAEHIGSNDLTKRKTRKAICELILLALNVTPDNENDFFNLQPWQIAAE